MNRFILTFDLNPAQIFKLKQRRNEAIGVLRQLHRPGFGCLLHTCCQIDGVANGRVFQSQIRAYRANHDHAGIDPDAHIDVDAPLALYLDSIGANAVFGDLVANTTSDEMREYLAGLIGIEENLHVPAIGNTRQPLAASFVQRETV